MHQVEGIYGHGRNILYQRRHRVWLRYVEPVICAVAAFGWFVAVRLFSGALIAVGFVAVVWFVYQYI
jgi:hypothetical protein